MKHLLTILFVVFATSIASARFGHHSFHHSSHSSHSSHSGHTSHHSTVHHISHGSSHHTTTNQVRSYSPVTKIQPHEIHTYPSGSRNGFIYYYLLFNHNTHTHDTIKSNSQADLQAQVLEISAEDDSPTSIGVVMIVLAGVVIVMFLVFLFLEIKG